MKNRVFGGGAIVRNRARRILRDPETGAGAQNSFRSSQTGRRRSGAPIRWLAAPLAVLSSLAFGGCFAPEVSDCTTDGDIEAGADLLCEREAYEDRNYLLHVPETYDGETPLPVVLSLHGFGLSKENQVELTCPEGDLESSDCLNALGDREGFVVVVPDAEASASTLWSRAWNANNADGWADDIEYIASLVADVKGVLPVDDRRIYAIGFSNGGAMAHSLACQLSDTVAAVVSVSGARELDAAECEPTRPMSVMQIHGDEDPVWPCEGGGAEDVAAVDDGMVGSERAPGWARISGCSTTPEEEELEDREDDGTQVIRREYLDCDDDAEVMTLVIEGGGHNWPSGSEWSPGWMVGPICWDLSANEVIWDFLSRHPMP